MQRALDELPDPLPLLVTTGDHPLLTPEIVAHFCAAARATGADLVAGLASAAAIRTAYPDAQRTYLRFRDERYSGANLFAVLKPEGRRAVAFWRRVEQERKRPWRLVRAFGWQPLLAYLLGRLTLDDAMARASNVIGARLAAVVLPHPRPRSTSTSRRIWSWSRPSSPDAASALLLSSKLHGRGGT